MGREGTPTRAHLYDLLCAIGAFEEEFAVAGVDRKLAQIELGCGRHLGGDRRTLHTNDAGHLAVSFLASCEGISDWDHTQPRGKTDVLEAAPVRNGLSRPACGICD